MVPPLPPSLLATAAALGPRGAATPGFRALPSTVGSGAAFLASQGLPRPRHRSTLASSPSPWRPVPSSSSSSSSGPVAAPASSRPRPSVPGARIVQRRSFLEQAGGDWDEMWRRKATPWDVGAPAPPLLHLLQRTDGTAPLPRIPGQSRALVGGCGSGYECVALAKAGWQVLGLDISATAVAHARELLAKEDEEEGKGLGKGAVVYEVGDFFALDEAAKFDLIFDYTFLCALPPALRPKLASKYRQLLAPGTGQLVTLIFPVADPDKDPAQLDLTNGPPFEVNPRLYRQLFLGEAGKVGFECLEMAGPCPESIKPRRGREWLARWRLPPPA